MKKLTFLASFALLLITSSLVSSVIPADETKQTVNENMNAMAVKKKVATATIAANATAIAAERLIAER